MHDQVHEGVEAISLHKDDGFRKDKDVDNAGYVIWDGENVARNQTIHYLHGALHLFDAGSELKKYTWKDTNVPLLQQARTAMDREMFPLFVAEGESHKKLAKIKHYAYLHHCYKSFSRVMEEKKQSLFVYGHSLAENDEHILRKIVEGKIEKIFVSVRKKNQQVIDKAQSLVLRRESLDVNFFDAETAEVWGSQ